MRKAKPKQRLQRKRPLKRWTIREIEAALKFHDERMYPDEVAELVQCHEGDVVELVALIAQRLAELREPPNRDPEAPLIASLRRDAMPSLSDALTHSPSAAGPQLAKRGRDERSVDLHGVATLPDFVARAMYDGAERPEAHARGGLRSAKPLSPEVESAADAAIAAATAKLRERKLARLGKPQGDPQNLD